MIAVTFSVLDDHHPSLQWHIRASYSVLHPSWPAKFLPQPMASFLVRHHKFWMTLWSFLTETAITGDEQLPGQTNFRDGLVYIRRSTGESFSPSFPIMPNRPNHWTHDNENPGSLFHELVILPMLAPELARSEYLLPMARVQSHTPNLALSRLLMVFSLSMIILPAKHLDIQCPLLQPEMDSQYETWKGFSLKQILGSSSWHLRHAQ